MSLEEFKSKCTEDFKPNEDDDEHTLNIKMLNFELHQRKEYVYYIIYILFDLLIILFSIRLWSQLTELRKKHKEVSEKVSNFNRSLNALKSRILDLEKSAKRIGDEISRINEEKARL